MTAVLQPHTRLVERLPNAIIPDDWCAPCTCHAHPSAINMRRYGCRAVGVVLGWVPFKIFWYLPNLKHQMFKKKNYILLPLQSKMFIFHFSGCPIFFSPQIQFPSFIIHHKCCILLYFDLPKWSRATIEILAFTQNFSLTSTKVCGFTPLWCHTVEARTRPWKQ